ncbi:Hypothetical predicted protein, partial [Paramuricea clavata]
EDTKIPDEDDHIEIGKENDDICIHNKEDSALETYIKSLDCQVRLLVKEFTTNKTTVDKTLQDHSKVLNQLQNLETNSELDSLRKENLQLKKLNDEFSKRINNLSCILADLQDKAKSAEDEKASLITAIKLLYKENERNQEQSNVNQADQINSEEQQRQQHDLTCHQVNPNIQINNRFAGLSVEEHTEEVSMLQVNAASQVTQTLTETRQKESWKASANSFSAEQKGSNTTAKKHDNKEDRQLKRHTTVLIGDSMIKNIQGPKLGKEVGNRVVVKSFPGAISEDMRHYIKPTIDRSPNRIVLHCGTNDLKSSSSTSVAERVVSLASEIEKTSETKVIISDQVNMIKLKPSTNNSENTAKVTAGHLFNIITLALLI